MIIIWMLPSKFCQLLSGFSSKVDFCSFRMNYCTFFIFLVYIYPWLYISQRWGNCAEGPWVQMGTWWSEWKMAEAETWLYTCRFRPRCSYYWFVFLVLTIFQSCFHNHMKLNRLFAIGGYFGSGRRGGEVSSFVVAFLHNTFLYEVSVFVLVKCLMLISAHYCIFLFPFLWSYYFLICGLMDTEFHKLSF